jgi:hypothetical protein
MTFLYLEQYRARQRARKDLSDRERERWRCQRTHGLCLAVRQAAEVADLKEIAERVETPGGIRRLKRLFNQAVPSEYRVAA